MSTVEVPTEAARRGPTPPAWLTVDLLAKVGFALLCVAALVLFFAVKTLPEYDSLYSLIWGRELLSGQELSFEAYRAPTEHPLWVAVGAVLSLFGTVGDRVMVLVNLGALVAMIAGTFRLGRVSFGAAVGFVAALLLATRLNFEFVALRGFLDVPYVACIVWAAALEVQSPRRGGVVWVLLAVAGLLRPEAWLLAGLYVIWCGWTADWGTRLKYVGYALIAPLLWAGVDLAVTGNPASSLTGTSADAEAFGRDIAASEAPSTTLRFLSKLTRAPVLILALIGAVVAWRLVGRRALIPGALFAIGVIVYLGLIVGGFSAIDRYLYVAAVVAMIFAAAAIAGWTLLGGRGGRALAIGWGVAGAIALIVALAYTGDQYTPGYIDRFVQVRYDTRPELEKLLADPAVKRGRECGPISVPNHKLIPELRWILDVGPDDVIARSDPDSASRARRGVAIVITDESVSKNPNFDPFIIKSDSKRIVEAPPGFRQVAATDDFAAFVRC